MKQQDFSGVELLRDAANWSGNRPEYLNANKTPSQIVNEYKKYLQQWEK